jgi:hypothetical protein
MPVVLKRVLSALLSISHSLTANCGQQIGISTGANWHFAALNLPSNFSTSYEHRLPTSYTIARKAAIVIGIFIQQTGRRDSAGLFVSMVLKQHNPLSQGSKPYYFL